MSARDDAQPDEPEVTAWPSAPEPPAPLVLQPQPPACRLILPAELHSEYHKGPFQTCSVCAASLLGGRPYCVQKTYRGKEVIFEMAVCQTCAEATSKELSEESMEALKGFLLSNFKPCVEAAACSFCGFPRHFVGNYTLEAVCQGHHLLVPAMMLCERCSEHLQSRLSKKTKDAQEGFVRDNFPGVPADLDFSPTLGGWV